MLAECCLSPKKSGAEQHHQELRGLKPRTSAEIQKENDKKLDCSDIKLKDLFQFADGKDKVYYWVGGAHAVLFGIAQPAICWVFGELFDSAMSGSSSGEDPRAKMHDLLWLFGAIGLMAWYTGMIFSWFFNVAMQRQMCQARNFMFERTVRQDVGWFDVKDAMTVPSQIMVDCRKIKEALGSQFALFIQNFAQFLGGYFFAFIISWQMTLVLTAFLPVMGLSAAFFVSALQELSSGQQKHYVRAGAVADEVFSAVKTVVRWIASTLLELVNRKTQEVDTQLIHDKMHCFTQTLPTQTLVRATVGYFYNSPRLVPEVSFGNESREQARYGSFLEEARQGKAKTSWRVGANVGSLWSVCFFMYALAFWYGAELVADESINYQENRAFTGGDVLKCFFCLLMGMFGIGSMAPWIQAWAEVRPVLKRFKMMAAEE